MRFARMGVLVVAAGLALFLPVTATGSPDGESTTTEAAPVAFSTVPAELTRDTTAHFEFPDPGEATCSLDGGEPYECSSPTWVEGLADGVHTFTVLLPDESSATHSWIVDTKEPSLLLQTSIPGWDGSNTPVTNETSASFTFSTREPSIELFCRMDPPITWKDVMLNLPNGSPTGVTRRMPVPSGPFVPCSSPQALSDLTEGLHMATVRAVDRAGNKTVKTINWRVDSTYVPPDTTAPTISIEAPKTLESDDYEIAFTVSEQADVVCRLKVGPVFFLEVTHTTTVEPCTSPVRWTDVPEGKVWITIDAIDPAGNKRGVGRGWTVDRTPPEVLLSAGPGSVSGPDSVFRFASSETALGQILECALDGGPWRSCASPVELKGLADGAHAFSIRATDPAGNTGPALVTEWTVDGVAPEARVVTGPDRLTSATSANFSIETDGDAAALECTLDDSVWQTCSEEFALEGLSEGPHEFRVRAIDSVGNTGPAASFWWSIDTTGPSVTIDSGPGDPSSSTTARLTWVSEAGATFRCRVDDRPWKACVSPTSVSSLADGPHTFEVIAADALGNEGPSASRPWSVSTPPPPGQSGPPPTVSITSGPPERTASRVAEFTVDHAPGTTLSCRSTLGLGLFPSAWAPCVSPIVVNGFAEGTHRFEVRANAPGGRVSTVKSWAWYVDVTAPTVRFRTTPLPTTATTLAEFSFFSSDRTATFSCRLDSGAWAPCSSPVELADLAIGSHTFEVAAIDFVGNRSAPVSHTWEILDPDPDYSLFGESDPAEVPPTGPATAPETAPEPEASEEPPAPTGSNLMPMGLGPGITLEPRLIAAPTRTRSRRPLFRFSAPAPGGRNICSVDRRPAVRCGTSWRPSGRLSTGLHLLRVRSRAADGTVSRAVTHRFRITSGR